ncbi:MAG TPA: GNAT family N-acetyltransferase [Dyella sp.]|uniref:GNAT family N-acetyltransferase n=1 Tax=Dyella sp. TaxID=1869338 RepID=UPI002D77E2C3|nr:GNAT family N-acetyltransferase [Dyella sp.]HET6552941.1 GNAT family N-acetyltransferase [Dyella sp.]
MSAAEDGALAIRRARIADIPDLVELCASHAAYERLPHAKALRIDALARALQGDPPQLHAWLAFVGSHAVGYASATLDFSTLDRASQLHMDCLYVADGWRQRSIGARLWEQVHALARELDCHAIEWQTPSWNTDAARFYGRLGATEMAKRRFRFLLPHND